MLVNCSTDINECFNAKKKDKTRIWSMGSVKILAFNQHYLNRIIRTFGLDHTWIKKQPEYQSLKVYWRMRRLKLFTPLYNGEVP